LTLVFLKGHKRSRSLFWVTRTTIKQEHFMLYLG